MSFNKAKILKSAEKYVQQGKIAAAIDEYRKIVEADPNDLTMINTLGDLCVRAGRTEEAIQNFSRIAENYRENGFTLKAIAMFKKISKLEPSNTETSLRLADLYSKQGLIVDARQQYLIVADAYRRNGQTKRSLEILQKIADLDPENTSVRLKLAESYHMEGMHEEALDAFIYAGQEFVKKNKLPEGIQAFQKALSINGDSKQALKFICDAYSQINELNKAFELLTHALDKNPGDTDLIVILGRTYLSAKMFDEAEQTFTRLLELDKSRYDYMIEVARRFLETGQFDKVVIAIDKCIDLLIARRQEEKAITLLKGILEYDANHMYALKRLADIYTRVREDHNLISTLNLIVEASLRNQSKPEAIAALRQLMEIEPDESSHRQRLASLGGDPIVQPTYTIPPAFESKSATMPLPPQAEPNVAEKQLREAEMYANRGYADLAAELLEELVKNYPTYVEARLKLKQIYIDGGLEDKAALQCLELSKLYESAGDTALASDLLSEAQELNPALAAPRTPLRSAPAIMPKVNGPAPSNASLMSDAVEIDLSGSLNDVSLESLGFNQGDVTPAPPPPRVNAPASNPFGGSGAYNIMPDIFGQASVPPPSPMPETPSQPPTSFESLFATPTLETPTTPPPINISVKGAPADIASSSFEISLEEQQGSSQLAKDKILRDELEGVDFYIAQGYLEIARDTLENLDKQYPNHPAITQRFGQLGIQRTVASPNSTQSLSDILIEPIEEPAVPPPSSFAGRSISDLGTPPPMSYAEPQPTAPAQDFMARYQQSPGGLSSFDSLVSEIDDALEDMPTSDVLPMAPPPSAPAAKSPNNSPAPQNFNSIKEPGLDDEFNNIFQEFKDGLEQNEQPDFETHYNLGLAYKDMELYDDAIEEFQTAWKASSPTGGDGNYFNCCNMLGFCFLSKDLARPAISWYKRGLDAPGRSEEEYQAMRYEMAQAYENLGELERALEYLHEVYALDVNYRNVAAKIKDIEDKMGGE